MLAHQLLLLHIISITILLNTYIYYTREWIWYAWSSSSSFFVCRSRTSLLGLIRRSAESMDLKTHIIFSPVLPKKKKQQPTNKSQAFICIFSTFRFLTQTETDCCLFWFLDIVYKSWGQASHSKQAETIGRSTTRPEHMPTRSMRCVCVCADEREARIDDRWLCDCEPVRWVLARSPMPLGLSAVCF